MCTMATRWSLFWCGAQIQTCVSSTIIYRRTGDSRCTKVGGPKMNVRWMWHVTVRGSNACSFILTDILNTGIETCMGVKIAQDESRQDGIRESWTADGEATSFDPYPMRKSSGRSNSEMGTVHRAGVYNLIVESSSLPYLKTRTFALIRVLIYSYKRIFI